MPRRPLSLALLLLGPLALLAEQPVEMGQRVFLTGHSFHMFVARSLNDVAKAGGYKDHVLVGQQGLGGSRVLQHWNLPDGKDKARAALRTGKIDVFTMSPHVAIPDEGIDHFVQLGLKHNKNMRFLVQASWYPFDSGMARKGKFKNADRDSAKIADLRTTMEPWLKAIREQVRTLNAKYERPVVFVVPAGTAVVNLREKVVEKKAPGIEKQSELFTDPIGHAGPPIAALVTYCHYAAIYRKSPVGLKVSQKLVASAEDNAKLHRLLQEIAWNAVTMEPLSGVKAEK